MNRRNVLIGLTGLTVASSVDAASLFHERAAEAASNENDALLEGTSEATQDTQGNNKPDIRKLSQHFTGRSEDISPWLFIPDDNIRSVSTTEHPGYATIWHGDKGEDIKGLLKSPIKIDEYPIPWEFHLGLSQYRSSELPNQCNYAFGLNLALTFSDPSTWPADRTQLPPGTHSTQIFVTHLKVPQIEPGPLNYDDPAHEVYLVYGRGDLDPAVNGNWNVPYVWQGPSAGSWSKTGGPASYNYSFRVKLASPTTLEVGFFGGLCGQPHVGWRMKTIDVSRFGKITGIWEIGPVISLDRWIPDVLAPELGLAANPPIKTSDSAYQFYAVDYAAFFGANSENLDHMSDDFDIPGFQAKWYHEGQALVEDYSRPGYLAVTLPAPSFDGWAMCPTTIGSTIVDLTNLKDFPGYEIEVGFIPPEDDKMWSLYISSIDLWDENGKQVGGVGPTEDPGAWEPGLQYFPDEKRHKFFNVFTNNRKISKGPFINVEFEPNVPESILSRRPLSMIAQILDSSHVRFGFRGKKTEPWYMSKIFDTTTTFGKIGKFNPHACITTTVAARGEKGWGIGNYPGYQRIYIDYVRFGYGISTSGAQNELANGHDPIAGG